MPLPLIGRFDLRVDVLDIVQIHLLDAVGYPSSLDLNGSRCMIIVS